MRVTLVLICLLGTAHAHRVPRVPPAPSADARAVIRKVVKKHMMRIFACFERDGLSSTKVGVDFTIGAGGKVTVRRVSSTGSAGLRRCVGDVFAKMTFPSQVAPVQVSYPVHICVAGQ